MASTYSKAHTIWRKLALDPEIYGLFGILTGVAGLAGYQLGRKSVNPGPSQVGELPDGESKPWRHPGGLEKGYQYIYKDEEGNLRAYHPMPAPAKEETVHLDGDVADRLKAKGATVVPEEQGKRS